MDTLLRKPQALAAFLLLLEETVLDALAEANSQQPRPIMKQLSDVRLAEDGSQVTFQWKQTRWAVEPDGTLTKLAPAPNAPPDWMTNSRRSLSGGAETELTITNELTRRSFKKCSHHLGQLGGSGRSARGRRFANDLVHG